MVLEMVAEEGGGGGGVAAAVSRRQLLQLRERSRGQARQLLATKRRLKNQIELAGHIHEERDANLRSIKSQLLLLEAGLRRRQEELATVLRQKDQTIRDQQKLILTLASVLSQVTGHKKIVEVLCLASKEDPSVDLVKVLKDILAFTPCLENDNRNSRNSSDQTQNAPTTELNNVLNRQKNTKREKRRNVPYSERIIKEETTDEAKPNDSTCDTKPDSDSVTDTDSAIMLEDTCSDSLVILPCMRDGVKVIRSVSDALECASRPSQLPADTVDSASITPVNSCPSSPKIASGSSNSFPSNSTRSSLSTTPSCSSCSEDSDDSPSSTLSKMRSLSRETLLNINEDHYSAEFDRASTNERNHVKTAAADDVTIQPLNEDHDTSSVSVDCESNLSIEDTMASPTYGSDTTISDETSDTEGPLENDLKCESRLNLDSAPERRLLLGSSGKTEDSGSSPYVYKKKPDEIFQVTYNRVMSNHRSVTKVKDVKYKRINKAKSRSLEELRGKLKLREGKPTISMSIGHSYA
ncbi:uncharacterized protein LOC108672096 [Hyalella azteca]|uniref:Uncharacterized protein LOC108672096 n=1 Tax=Hyalella azteca TaxID=294128 RepID=A0A8B7NNF4_HYAAZ|nr:uncharacterized protein LOC108672096 [Hyalella azteca]